MSKILGCAANVASISLAEGRKIATGSDIDRLAAAARQAAARECMVSI